MRRLCSNPANDGPARTVQRAYRRFRACRAAQSVVARIRLGRIREEVCPRIILQMTRVRGPNTAFDNLPHPPLVLWSTCFIVSLVQEDEGRWDLESEERMIRADIAAEIEYASARRHARAMGLPARPRVTRRTASPTYSDDEAEEEEEEEDANEDEEEDDVVCIRIWETYCRCGTQ